jgi:hypothetical protein
MDEKEQKIEQFLLRTPVRGREFETRKLTQEEFDAGLAFARAAYRFCKVAGEEAIYAAPWMIAAAHLSIIRGRSEDGFVEFMAAEPNIEIVPEG